MSTLFLVACNDSRNDDKQPIVSSTQTTTYDKDIGDSSVFRMAIVKSIAILYKRRFDTLIIKSEWRFLDEVPIDYPINYPQTYIDKHPYIDTLSKLLNIKVITDSTFDKYMDMILKTKFKGDYPTSLFDTCLADNIYVNVVAKKLKDNSILVITDYRTVDTSIRTVNKFMRLNGKWSFKEVNPYTFK
ncbi:hypothetical protein [Ferruginibacter profundus]